MKKGNVIVLAGLSATGKTTLMNWLSAQHGWLQIPEHKEWRTKHNKPSSVSTIEQKKQKQLFFYDIDRDRSEWARNKAAQGMTVVADSDFLSPLAHNFSERRQTPELDVYPWLVDLYTAALLSDQLTVGDAYVYLDASLNTRKARRVTDNGRQRNSLFFESDFAQRMREFYYLFLYPCSEQRILNSTWLSYDKSFDEVAPAANHEISELLHKCQQINLHNLIKLLRSTI